MKPAVSGTDDQGHRHVSQVSQTATSSEAKLEVCPVTTPNRHITYTITQLHKRLNALNVLHVPQPRFIAPLLMPINLSTKILQFNFNFSNLNIQLFFCMRTWNELIKYRLF